MSYRRPKPKPPNPHRWYVVDPCGECPKGKCDRCAFCLWAMDLPGSREHIVHVSPVVRSWGLLPTMVQSQRDATEPTT